MSDDNLKRTTVKLNADAVEVLKDRGHGVLSDVLRTAANREAFGAEVSERRRLKDQLEDLRDERGELQKERARIESELNEVNRKIERTEARLDELRDREGEYEGRLADIEETLHRNPQTCVWETHPRVEEAAELVDKAPAEVIEELQERNPELGDEKFTEGVGRGGRR